MECIFILHCSNLFRIDRLCSHFAANMSNSQEWSIFPQSIMNIELQIKIHMFVNDQQMQDKFLKEIAKDLDSFLMVCYVFVCNVFDLFIIINR